MIKVCKNGHPRTAENLLSNRYCKLCYTAYQKAYHQQRLEKLRSAECECGNTKEPRAVACERCMFLDGYRSDKRPASMVGEVIHVLYGRELRSQELQQYLGLDEGGFHRIMRGLIKQGRVSKRYETCVYSDQVEALYRLEYKRNAS